MLAHPTHSSSEQWTHIGVEAGNAGTDSIVAPSRDMGGAVSAFLREHPSALPAQTGIRAPHPLPRLSRHPYTTPTGRLASLSHPDWLRASPGASPQLQGQFPQGLVQLIMHQVDLLSRQSEQLRLAQGGKQWPWLLQICPEGIVPTQGSHKEGQQLTPLHM